MAFAPSSRRSGNPVESAIKPVVERLERRTLLSVSLGDDGILAIDGTPDADKVVVKPLGKTQIRVVDNGQRHDFDKKAVRRIVFDGGAGDDSFRMTNYGGKHDPRVFARGGDGDDVITTLLGNDKIYGGAGDDLISVGKGHNYANGGAGDDTIVARDGKDVLLGGPGKDQVATGRGKQQVRTGRGVDSTSSLKPHFPISTYTPNPTGYTPRMQRYAYGLGSIDDGNYDNRGQGQAIALVGAYDLPNIYQDMKQFTREYDLPSMNKKQLRVINLAPKSRRLVDEDWYGEAMLDAQWAHAIAPKARIYMVQAATNASGDIMAAVEKAKRILNNGFGGGVISMSLGSDNDNEFERVFNAGFRGPDTRFISFIVSAGDTGGTNSSPSTSPNVVSVGGTALYLDEYGNRVAGAFEWPIPNPVRDPNTQLWVWGGHHICGEDTGLDEQDGDYDRNIFPGGEVAWWDGGGGPSNIWDMPEYQENRNIPGTNRGTPDVAWNGDPATGVPVYSTIGSGGISGWAQVGGTSAGAPQFAAMVALANQRRADRGRPPVGSTLLDRIYRVAGRGVDSPFYDIGSPGGPGVYHGSDPFPPGDTEACNALFVNGAFPGWDFATGWGTPNGSALIPALADEKVPLTRGRLRISGSFTDELVGTPVEYIGFNMTTPVAGYGTVTVQSAITSQVRRTTHTQGGGATPVTNSVFFVDVIGADDQDGRADFNGFNFTAVNGTVTELTLQQGTGTPLKLYKHGNSVQGQGFIMVTEAVLADDGGTPDPDTFVERTVAVRFVGKSDKKGRISGRFWAIGPDGERLKNEFDPNTNVGVMLAQGRFEFA